MAKEPSNEIILCNNGLRILSQYRFYGERIFLLRDKLRLEKKPATAELLNWLTTLRSDMFFKGGGSSIH